MPIPNAAMARGRSKLTRRRQITLGRLVVGCPLHPPKCLRDRIERQSGRTHGDGAFEHGWKFRVTRTSLRMRKPRRPVGPAIRVFPRPFRSRLPRCALHFRVEGIGRLVLLLPDRIRASQPCRFPERDLLVCWRRFLLKTPSRPPSGRIGLSSVHSFVHDAAIPDNDRTRDGRPTQDYRKLTSSRSRAAARSQRPDRDPSRVSDHSAITRATWASSPVYM